MSAPLFRQSALDSLSSPEQLDKILIVTKPLSWLGLAGVAAAVLATVIWSIVGEIPTKVDARGLLIKEGGLHSVQAQGSGIVISILPAIGSMIHSGDTVAIIDVPDLALKVANAQAAVQEADSLYRLTLTSITRQRTLLRESSSSQSRENDARIAAAERRIDQSRKTSAASKDLVDRGLLTNAEYFSQLEEVLSAEQDLIAARTAGIQLQVSTTDSDYQKIQQVLSAEQTLRQAIRAAREARLAYDLATIVRSSYSGRVVQLSAGEGQQIAAGNAVVVVEIDSSNDDPIEVALFISPAEGKKVDVGMTANIVPSTVAAEEVGSLIGDVFYVSDYPLDQRGMAYLIDNDALMAYFGIQNDPPLAVLVRLRRDHTTPSGYAWTSGRGPDIKVTAGMVCQGSVVVSQQAPITLALPWLKKKVGLGDD